MIGESMTNFRISIQNLVMLWQNAVVELCLVGICHAPIELQYKTE